MEEITVRVGRQTQDTSTQLELTFQRPTAVWRARHPRLAITSPIAELEALEADIMSTPDPPHLINEIAQVLAFLSEIDFGLELLNTIPMPTDHISKEKYATFTSRRFKKADALKGFHQDNCVICAEKFKSNQKIPILPCGHDFHWKCLGKWVTKQKKSCPICKADVC